MNMERWNMFNPDDEISSYIQLYMICFQGLSKQTDMQVRQIERWFRIRRNQDRTPVMKKFCESR